jgi:pyridoxine kinase
VLSTHTAGFTGFTFRDLTDYMPPIQKHWQKESILFDCIYTGYLGSVKQVGFVKDILQTMGKENAVKIVDPAFADGGKLYSIFDLEYVNAMKTLCRVCDFLIPNISEACFLTRLPYKEEYDDKYIKELLSALHLLGAKFVVLTGVSLAKEKTGVVVPSGDKAEYYEHEKIAQGCHGTGDVYASAFTGALMKGFSAFDSAKIAADFVVDCIRFTGADEQHWYGVKFEPMLGSLIQTLGK